MVLLASRHAAGRDQQVVPGARGGEGAGVITSLTETQGLVELPEELTRLAAGDSVGFLPYAALIGP